MKVIALLIGTYTISCWHDVTDIGVTSSAITITGILEGSNATTPTTYTLDKTRYIVRIIEN